MANILSKTGITEGSTIHPSHFTQSIDAFTGIEAYDISLSGSLTLTGSYTSTGDITASGNISSSATIIANSMGVGYSPDPSFKLDVLGSARITDTLTVNTTVYTSQADLKEQISGITKTKAKVIEFKEYQFKSDSGDRKRYGVLAEDIEDDYPELVYTGPDGVKGVNYIDLLVKRVAELEKELADIPVGNHLSNVTSIAINNISRTLEIVIDGNTYTLYPDSGDRPIKYPGDGLDPGDGYGSDPGDGLDPGDGYGSDPGDKYGPDPGGEAYPIDEGPV